MSTIEIILSILLIVLSIAVILGRKGNNEAEGGEKMKEAIRLEMRENRAELNNSLKTNREELNTSLERLSKTIEDRLDKLIERLNQNAKDNREELSTSLKEFTEAQGKKFDSMSQKQDELVKTTEIKLDKMRETVDEKLHKTLEERLGQSFKLVSERLEAVQKGLGEMQTLASGVGDLKKVLSNVKTRGVLGEYQLGNILEQILAPSQYDQNVKTKKGSNDLVEFAIKLPGNDEGEEVYLPLDAKFPTGDYQRLQNAAEENDVPTIDIARKSLYNSVKKFAKDIHEKYVDPPNTTDIAIMFLPIEGLYAEVVREPGLILDIQSNYKVIITGPTTLAAMVNSFAMGFRTLAIQKRSSEVWKVLGAVKTEFTKFGGVLEKAQKKLNEANKEIDTLVGTRTRMMISKLKNVEELPQGESQDLLEGGSEIVEIED